jgi:hypothetical protein
MISTYVYPPNTHTHMKYFVGMYPKALSDLAQANVAMNRINDYMDLPELQPYVTHTTTHTRDGGVAGITIHADPKETKNAAEIPAEAGNDAVAISLNNAVKCGSLCVWINVPVYLA